MAYLNKPISVIVNNDIHHGRSVLKMRLKAYVLDIRYEFSFASETVLPEKPWHSVTLCFWGKVVGGSLRAEPDHPFGDKTPQWLSYDELQAVPYHPPTLVEKALGFAQLP